MSSTLTYHRLICAFALTLCAIDTAAQLSPEELISIVRMSYDRHESSLRSYSAKVTQEKQALWKLSDLPPQVRAGILLASKSGRDIDIVIDILVKEGALYSSSADRAVRLDLATTARSFGESENARYKMESQLANERNLFIQERYYSFDTLPMYGEDVRTGLWIFSKDSNQARDAQQFLDPQLFHTVGFHQVKPHVHIERSYLARERDPEEVEITLWVNQDDDIEFKLLRTRGEGMALKQETMVFARDKGYLLKRVEQSSFAGGMESLTIKWDLYQDGEETIYFPASIEQLIENPASGRPPQYTRWIFEDVKINIDIPAERFTLEDLGMDTDTLVLDRVANQNYDLVFSGLVNSLEPSQRQIDELMQDIRDDLNAEPFQDPPDAQAPAKLSTAPELVQDIPVKPSVKRLQLLGGAGIAFALLLMLTLRRRRNRLMSIALIGFLLVGCEGPEADSVKPSISAPKSYDYGVVTGFKTIEVTIPIKNIGARDLLVTKIDTSCGCVSPERASYTSPGQRPGIQQSAPQRSPERAF